MSDSSVHYAAWEENVIFWPQHRKNRYMRSNNLQTSNRKITDVKSINFIVQFLLVLIPYHSFNHTFPKHLKTQLIRITVVIFTICFACFQHLSYNYMSPLGHEQRAFHKI